MRTSTELTPELREFQALAEARARDYGLDFFDTIFEVVDFDTMNQLATYGGFPVRYPHWRWGMEYEKLRKRDAYGLGRIYEMVINNDPCYAYLQESNSLMGQKLVMAHVYAHCDFFKCNAWFAHTPRNMMDQMANHAIRVQRYIDRIGLEPVERFLDACLSLEHLIDPHSMFMRREAARHTRPPGSSTAPAGVSLGSADGDDRDVEVGNGRPGTISPGASGRDDPLSAAHRRQYSAENDDPDARPRRDDVWEPDRLPAKDYMDRFINPPELLEKQRQAFEAERQKSQRQFPDRPTRDVLLFLLRHAPLADWQRDILSMIRTEAYYFAPQAMTKIMNEGWATYWHSKIMTNHLLEASEVIDYAEQHSGVVFMQAGGFNPYKIGVEIFKDIERRWDRGQHGPAWEALEGIGEREAWDDGSREGRDKMFQVRRIYNDVNFVEEYLTDELIHKLKLYHYRRDPRTGQMVIASRDPHVVRQTMLYRISNMGQPFMYVADANYNNRGELYLAHQWNGLEVDASKAREVLRNMVKLWGRPVHLQMRIQDEMCLLTFDPDGNEVKVEKITDGMPKPIHQIE
ncbi:MAG: SpoVR family protein [Planctomycetota bacterium]